MEDDVAERVDEVVEVREWIPPPVEEALGGGGPAKGKLPQDGESAGRDLLTSKEKRP